MEKQYQQYGCAYCASISDAHKVANTGKCDKGLICNDVVDTEKCFTMDKGMAQMIKQKYVVKRGSRREGLAGRI